MITDKYSFNKKIKRVLITEDQIQREVENCGRMLSREYEGKPLLLVSILKGAFVFLSDLNKKMTIPCEIGLMAAKSYFEGTSAEGDVEITYDLAQDISRYNVVVVEDIIDTGRTLAAVLEMLKSRNPISLKVLTLLDKPDRRLVELTADWSLFTIPDHFVIGYGLDCGEYYRNLPYIAEYEEQEV